MEPEDDKREPHAEQRLNATGLSKQQVGGSASSPIRKHSPTTLSYIALAAQTSAYALKLQTKSDGNADATATNQGIFQLNEDCFELILKKLPQHDQLHFALTCRYFQRLFFRFTLLSTRRADMKLFRNMGECEMNDYFQLFGPNLETFGGILSKDNNGVLRYMSEYCGNVKTISFDCCFAYHNEAVNNQAPYIISKLTNLESLKLVCHRKLTGQYLFRLENLHTLNLYGCRNLRDDYLISVFKSLEKLRSLNIMGCDRLTRASFDQMARFCLNLEVVKFTHFEHIECESIVMLPKLATLCIEFFTSLLEFLQMLVARQQKQKQKLQSLTLNKLWSDIHNRNSITQQHFEQIVRLSELKELYLVGGWNIGELHNIGNFPELELLSFTLCCSIMRQGFLHLLSKCERLRMINFEESKDIDNGFILDAIELLKEFTPNRETALTIRTKNTSITERLLTHPSYIAAKSLIKVCFNSLGPLADKIPPKSFH